MLTKEQADILSRYFTNTDKPVFALVNLPEVIKGTLFSRYSRSAKDLRRLFFEEFVNEEVLKEYFAESHGDGRESILNTAKADDFYERILVGYGDDSVAELGGAHVAIEEVSMLATKSIEEHRVGLSPLEKSTRYVYYDKKVDGEYQYVKDSRIMASRYANRYCGTMTLLMETYSEIVRDIQPMLKELFPGDENEQAYKFSIRAKACDIARGLLPLAAKTNMGVYGNGRAFEYLITNLLHDPLAEARDIGTALDENLKKVISAFIKRATNERGNAYRAYLSATEENIQRSLPPNATQPEQYAESSVMLVDADPDAIEKILAAVAYRRSNGTYASALECARAMSAGEKEERIKAFFSKRTNRHHKPGREAEEAMFCFDVVADWGVYKDLMRHRILTRHHQLFTNEHGYWIPQEINLAGFGEKYRGAMDAAVDAYREVKKDFPVEAQYLVTHGAYNRFSMRMNLRAVIHMAELRATPQGHPTYRKVAQDMALRVGERFPLFGKYAFPFVDFNDYGLERLDAFRRLEKKAATFGVKGFEE